MSTKKDSKATTALATVKDSDNVRDMLKFIQQEFETLKQVKDTPYLTSGAMPGFPTNLKEERESRSIIQRMSRAIAMERDYNLAAQRMGLHTFPEFQCDGFPSSSWEADCRLRMAIVTSEERFRELEALKKETEDLMEKEDRKIILAEKMRNFVKKNQPALEE